MYFLNTMFFTDIKVIMNTIEQSEVWKMYEEYLKVQYRRRKSSTPSWHAVQATLICKHLLLLIVEIQEMIGSVAAFIVRLLP